MTIEQIRAFDPDAACPKCGRTPVGTRSCGYTTPSPGLYGPFHWPMWVSVVGGHLHRKCGRCDHEWIELAISARMMTPDEEEAQGELYQKASEEYFDARFPGHRLSESESKDDVKPRRWWSL